MKSQKRMQPVDNQEDEATVGDESLSVQQQPEVPVTIVTEAQGSWRVQWTDAVGRLRQSWSPHRIERGTLSSLESLPPHGDDLGSVLVDICIPVSTLVATLHYMNIWEVKQITYQAMRDLLASQAGAEFIALEARVQALNASKP